MSFGYFILFKKREYYGTKKILKSRRSYRHEFSDRKVTKEELKYIMEAAYLAPSGCNLQTSRIIEILDQEKIKTLEKYTEEIGQKLQKQ